ncbi:beta-N-acetylhexosaminidase [Lewinella sp. W8]|uniref:beta-N-acetylhexosaminidase n=1 Tax=Lewinella sp. W8 TaxID=2528208 RepID=UPI001067AB5C|nr:family 20 glycosylhydrolase [Lewinella sp. W8]MTB49460.1 family 20 glycosylhydrolase [Lewinella sp. W8]
MLRFLLPLFFLPLLACTDEPDPVIGEALIIPRPAELVEGTGAFVFTPGMTISVEEEAQEKLLQPFLANFADRMGWSPAVTTDTGGNITLATDPALGEEAYNLSVTPAQIRITAATGAGFFYALQSIRQMMPPEFFAEEGVMTSPVGIPSVEIRDAPAFGWRGYMLDVSRHFFSVGQVKEVLDMMAANKFNRFHWHLTDDQGWRIEIKGYPNLTEVGAWRADRLNTDERYSDWWGRAPQGADEPATYGGYYTQEEIREIVAYAADRFIEVVPEIDMPGHAQAAVAAYPEIGAVKALPTVATGGVFRYNTINPGKEETYDFARVVLNEVMDLFPFPYLHIGGDECNKEQWEIDPDAQRKMREESLQSEEELQSYFIQRMEEIINARGRTMIGWDEILEGGLAPNATVMSWRGEEGGLTAARAGHEVIMTPSKFCYLDLKQGHDDLEPNLGYSRLLLSTAYNYDVIPQELSEEEARLIKGIQANMWTESISDWSKFTYMNYPRVFAVAENAWTSSARQDWDDFIGRVLYAFRKLDARQVRYAESAFSPWMHHRRLGDKIEIRLETEATGLDVRYTLDGTAPDTSALKYSGPFTIGAGELVTAQAFLDGEPIGYPVSLDLPIHAGMDAKVTDRSGQALPKLSNLQYAKLTPVDTNWHKFSGNELALTMTFPEPRSASSLRFSTLRYTISGIYPPGSITVYGDRGDGEFVELASLEEPEKATQQGRNKVAHQLSFPATTLRAIRVEMAAFGAIPEGHHRAGARARIYLDELIVE